MQADTMNTLPDEVFLEIFNYFNGKSLKALMLVCKRWHAIISAHASTMRRLPVDLRKLLLSYDDGCAINHFHTLFIEHTNIFDNDLHEHLLTGLGRSVQHLNISYCVLNASHLGTLLASLRHLSHLTITKSRMSAEEEMSSIGGARMEVELKKLKIMHINYGILKHMSNIQVTELEIIDASNYKINHEHAIEFILRQKSLRSLIVEELNNNVNSIFLTNDLKRAAFRLQSFSGLFCTNLARHEFFNDNLIAFLGLHSKSLEACKISGTSLAPNTFKFAIASLSNLSTLEINPNSIPQESSFYSNIPRNSALKVLIIQSTVTRDNFSGFLLLLQHYPHVCDLSLLDTCDLIANDLYRAIARELKFLSSLSVLNFSRNFSPSHQIASLFSFSIKILNDIDQFLKFISMNDTLEKISVGWMKRDFGEDVVEKIISQPKLKCIKFGGRFIANKRIYEVVSRDFKNLRTLELVVNNYDEIKNLKFVFPLNRSNYVRSKCLYFEECSDREPLND